MQPSEYLMSTNGEYALVMQPADGNLVLYQGSQALWSSGAQGAGSSVTMQSDGNLVIYNAGVAKWNSNTSGFSGAYLQLQDDNNVVIYDKTRAVWDWGSGYLGNQLSSGGTLNPGDELISPGHAYTLVMQPADGNLVLYQGTTAVWDSGAQGAGSSVTMQSDGNLVIYNAGTAKWNSGTSGFSSAYLQLQDDNNLVIYQGTTALWDWRNGRLNGGGAPGVSFAEQYPCTAVGFGGIVIAGSKWAPGVTGDNNIYSNDDSGSCANGYSIAKSFIDTTLPAYQCTEMAVRWAYNYGGIDPAAWLHAGWNGAAYDMFGRAVAGTQDIPNGGSVPTFGDLLIWNDGGLPGHVAVVLGVSGGKLFFVGENQGYSEDYVLFNSSTNQASEAPFGAGTVTGWIRFTSR